MPYHAICCLACPFIPTSGSADVCCPTCKHFSLLIYLCVLSYLWDQQGSQGRHAQGKQRGTPAWKVDFQTWKPGSAHYDNVDAAMDMQLTTLYFFCNRPTVAALMGLGTDLGDAFKDPASPEAGAGQPDLRRLESSASLSESEYGAEGGLSRLSALALSGRSQQQGGAEPASL